MKKMMILAMLAAFTVLNSACSSDDPLSSYTNNNTPTGTPADNNNSGSGGNSGSTAGTGELLSFNIQIDKSTAEPTDAAAAYYPEEEDDFSQNSFTTEVSIDMSNPVAKTENGVEISVNGGHVTANHGSAKSICYVVSGSTSNGSLTILGDKKYELKLNGTDITNPDSAAVNLLSKKRAYIVLSGTNKVTDGTSSKNEHKGAFYGKGKMLFNGTGSLEVYGNYNNGIHCTDYIIFSTGNNVYVKSAQNHGIKANDGIFINGGILNVEVSAAAAKGINCESNITINGGRTTVITTGNGMWDTEDLECKGAAGIKADSTFTINAGELYLKSTGSGGKGINADQEGYFNGGKVYILTTGGQFASNNDTSSPKGIKIDSDLYLRGATIMVRTTGNNGEGIESKSTLTIEGGDIQISAYDDAINSAGDMYIKGGSIMAYGTQNDAIDANGNMYISGGTLVAMGSGGAETGIDIGEQYKLYITGGNLFGIGGRIDGNLGSTTQGIATTTGSVQANGTVTIASGSTTVATFTMPPYSYQNGTIVVSAPGMTSGQSYTLNLGNSSTTITATNSLNSGMGGGGFGPGGRW